MTICDKTLSVTMDDMSDAYTRRQVSCSRRDSIGRLNVVTTTPNSVPAGTTFSVLGNDFEVDSRRIGFLGRSTGRFNRVTAPQKSVRDPMAVDRQALATEVSSRLVSRMRRGQLDAAHARLVARAVKASSDTPADRKAISKRPATVIALRGLPVVGAPGVGGAIPGTSPGRRL